MRGNNSSSTCGCVVTGKFARHSCAPPNRQGFFVMLRGSVGSVSVMSSDSVSTPIRRLFSVSSLTNASCALVARLVAQQLARYWVLAVGVVLHVTKPLGLMFYARLVPCRQVWSSESLRRWRVGKEVGEWADMSPCKGFISLYTKPFSHGRTRHDVS